MDDRASESIAAAFPYHRSISPALGVLLGLALVETAVLHLIAMALWGWPIALPLGLLDVALVAVLVGLLRSIRARPVTIADGVLTMRLGWLKVVPIPLAHVAGLRGAWDAAAMKAPGVMNLALAAWPNVVVDVAPPVRVRRRDIVAVAHKLDDPAVFVAALDRARAAQAPAT